MDNDEYKNINEQENNFNGENNQEDNGDDSSYENINNNKLSHPYMKKSIYQFFWINPNNVLCQIRNLFSHKKILEQN